MTKASNIPQDMALSSPQLSCLKFYLKKGKKFLLSTIFLKMIDLCLKNVHIVNRKKYTWGLLSCSGLTFFLRQITYVYFGCRQVLQVQDTVQVYQWTSSPKLKVKIKTNFYLVYFIKKYTLFIKENAVKYKRNLKIFYLRR